jgi:hypothetical protein
MAQRRRRLIARGRFVKTSLRMTLTLSRLTRLFSVGIVATSWVAVGSELRLTIVESDAQKPVPCRIHLKDASGKPLRPGGLPFWHDHFVSPGVAKLDLTPGAYKFEVDRGPEYLVTTGVVRIAEAKNLEVTNRLQRLVDLSKEGWWSGELHVHRSLDDSELLMRAEDLHIAPVITWWNSNSEWSKRAIPSALLVQFDGNRYFHLMGGEDERGGGALLYFNLTQPLPIIDAGREYPSPMKFLADARHHEGVWVDIEKPFWYDTPVWLASGMVDSIGIAHNHMQRDGVMANEAWGRARDKRRFPDPQGNGLWTQEIYYHVLNCGLRLPPSAGSASGVLANPVGYDRMYVHLDGELSYEKWWQGVKAGRVFVSNGPLLRCQANSQLPGYVFKSETGAKLDLQVEATLDARDPISSIEIIQDGRVIRTLSDSSWKGARALGTVTFKESGWFLVRAIAAVPNTFRFASTGPFYVEIGSKPFRISRTSAQFFLDWVRERQRLIKIVDPTQQAEVLAYQKKAEQFWEEKISQANAD